MATQYYSCKYCNGGIEVGIDICPFCKKSQTTGARGVSPQGGSSSPWTGKKWEYKRVLQSRSWDRDTSGKWYKGSSWSPPIDQILVLGEEGWELVSVVPVSTYLGNWSGADARDFAGFTSEQLWIFKRPK